MSGRLIDLAQPGSQLPPTLVVDTNVTLARFLAAAGPPRPQAARRAAQFFQQLQANRSVGLITSTSAYELFHFAIKAKYRTELPRHRAALVTAYGPRKGFDWMDLYKLNPGILQQFAVDLHQLRQLLILNGLVFLQPEDLGPLPAGQTLEEALVEVVGRYGLDTTDAAILLEAQRAGVLDVVTFDADMQRAQADFAIYTWR